MTTKIEELKEEIAAHKAAAQEAVKELEELKRKEAEKKVKEGKEIILSIFSDTFSKMFGEKLGRIS